MPLDDGLRGTVALVTGASSGIGEVTGRHLRVSLIEPGAVETELADHNRDEVREQIKARFAEIERLQAADVAGAIAFVVTRPRHVAINEILVRPTEQAG